MGQRILIVDTAPVIYQIDNTPVGKFTIQPGNPRAGEKTGVRYGLLRNVSAYKRELMADKVVLVWDCVGKPKKAEGISSYKSNRTFTSQKQEMYDQVPAAKELFKLTNWTQVQSEGFEADDVAATVANKLAAQGHDCFICSTDNDFCQCITEKIKIWIPGSKARAKTKKAEIEAGEGGQLKDREWVIDHFGIAPKFLLLFRAIKGDTSDNLEGIGTTGLGHRLRETVENAYEIWKHYESKTLEDLAEAFKVQAARNGVLLEEVGMDILKRNLNLMSMHDPETLQVTKGSKDVGKLTKEFEELTFKSLTKLIPELTA